MKTAWNFINLKKSCLMLRKKQISTDKHAMQSMQMQESKETRLFKAQRARKHQQVQSKGQRCFSSIEEFSTFFYFPEFRKLTNHLQYNLVIFGMSSHLLCHLNVCAFIALAHIVLLDLLPHLDCFSSCSRIPTNWISEDGKVLISPLTSWSFQ